MVCLDQREITSAPSPEDLSLAHFFTYLCDSKKNPLHILPGEEVRISCKKNQVISLIPFYGPVVGITTHGLQWEMTNDQLDKHFIGISNICLRDSCTISIEQGELLCMINEMKID
ncbi:MAG: hypothetical protein C5B45_01735 [Chlamydiae bacterium]|nr:MAG: hypothetical protein C5B45_01735 [Chlamydiota bacterium]